MLRLKLYYHVKPFLPWSLRMAVRRYFARRKRQLHQDIWPIDPSASEAPSNWTGWPDDKDFAFILSHDVETQVGYDKVEQLVELEERLGFRSVINFIPEGQYRVSKERIQNLKSRDFEVGVHGLHHDGKLYNRRSTFEKRAERINHYLKQWDSNGFRSPLMHHKLDWLHSLDITYDASTFDTDPFEPQPDGLGTIFPKWIPKPEGRGQRTEDSPQPIRNPQSAIRNSTYPDESGYVELPYTLPQDSTLFLLLREKTNEIWIQKTAWIAKHGGMAFINVHPDYIDFDGNGNSSQYPASHYADFLKHVKESYADQYWHATPNEVAERFVRSQRTEVGERKSEA